MNNVDWVKLSILNIAKQIEIISTNLLKKDALLTKDLNAITDHLNISAESLHNNLIYDVHEIELSHFKRMDRYLRRQSSAMFELDILFSKLDKNNASYSNDDHLSSINDILENLSNSLKSLITISMIDDNSNYRDLMRNVKYFHDSVSTIKAEDINTIDNIDAPQFFKKIHGYAENFVINVKQTERFILDKQRDSIDQESEITLSFI